MWALAAQHPRIPPEKLQFLATHSSIEVRGAAASDPSLANALFKKFAKDPAYQVHLQIARRPDLSPGRLKSLLALAENEHWAVLWALLRNPALPLEGLEILARQSKHPFYAREAAALLKKRAAKSS